MDPSETAIQLLKFRYCPVCGKVLTKIANPSGEQLRMCPVDGVGRIVPNELEQAMLAFETFDV